MKKYWLPLIFLFVLSFAHAEELIKLRPNEKPISVGDFSFSYDCKGNVDNKFLDLLYSLAKKYALKSNVTPPSKKFCHLTAIHNDKHIYGMTIAFYERKPPLNPNSYTEGISVTLALKKENFYWLVLDDSGYLIKSGICVDSKGNEVEAGNC